MTNAFEPIRQITRKINKEISKIESAKIGIIKDVSRIDNAVKVEIPEFNDDLDQVWIDYIFPYAANGVQMGGMPLINSKVLLIYLDNGSVDRYSNVFAFGGIFDKSDNIKPNSTDSNADNDRWYFPIIPKNGGSIEFYEVSENDHKLVITARKDLVINVENDTNFTVNGNTNLICSDISLGEASLGDSKKIVLKPHLDKYDSLVDAINTWIQGTTVTLTAAEGLLGVIPPQAPIRLATWTAASNLAKENNTNITSKTKAT